MKTLTRKLLVSILTLVFAVFALGTTTFAWFTLGGEAKVGQIDVTITTGIGLEVSLDNSHWYSNLPTSGEGSLANHLTELVKTALNNNSVTLADFSFIDLTSDDGITFEKTNGTAATDAFKDGFIEFTLYVRATGAYDIYLAKDSSITDNASSWSADASVTNTQVSGKDITAGTSATFHASNATRISFTEAVTTVWAPENASTSYGNAITNGFAKAYADTKGFEIGTTIVPLTPDCTDISFTETAKTLLVCSTNEPTGNDTFGTPNEVVIRIWLEGWDADCINAILKQTVTINLNLARQE